MHLLDRDSHRETEDGEMGGGGGGVWQAAVEH